MLVCIERDLEVLCLLEVQVFIFGGFLEALLEPWRSFEDPWKSFQEGQTLEELRGFGGHLEFRGAEVLDLVLFGGISKHWMCMCPHSSIVSLDLSWLTPF